VADRVAALLAERVPPERDGYLGVEGAAKYLGRPKSRIYELVAAKRLRHYRDGRSLLFRREDLDAVLRVRGVEA
jgi:excisionase family DNA binding protein